MLLDQTFSLLDLSTIGLLVVLEGLLSVDNALVLGLLAKRVPVDQQNKALTYGLIGAMFFRLLAVLLATYLLRWHVLKLLGGLYLIGMSLRHLVFVHKPKGAVGGAGHGTAAAGSADSPPKAEQVHSGKGGFWWAVIGIEVTDLAFAVDNILAAVALVGPPPPGRPPNAVHPKLWVILTGGMLGVVMMRFAAALCVKLLRRFPRFDTSAYLVVVLVAFKMILEWAAGPRPGGSGGLDFTSPAHAPFWAFWASLAACFAVGFLPAKRHPSPAGAATVRTPALSGTSRDDR